MLLIALAVSVDGMLAGFALGLRRVKIPFRLLLVISFTAFVCVYISMSLVKAFLAESMGGLTGWIGGTVLVAVGLFSLKSDGKAREEARLCSLPEAVAVGLSVAADASLVAASLALDGAPPLPVALLMAATHFVLVWGGNLAGQKGIKLRGLALRLVPAGILILLGILRLPIVPI